MSSILDPDGRQADPSVKLAIALLRVSQALAVAQVAAAEGGGISPLQGRVLLDLEAAWPEPLSPSGLADRYGISRATLSESLAGLREAKLVRVRAGREDRRRREVFPTARGRRLARRMDGELSRLVRMAESLPEEQRAQTLAGLVELIGRFVAAGWIATDRLCVTCRFFERDRHPGSDRPHHCALIDLPLGAAELRVDCPDHEPRSPDPQPSTR